MTSAEGVCVVGAGPSGIAAAKALHERGIPFDCFERRSRIGGLWSIADDVQASYPSLECNTSTTRTQFSDFPMPKEFPPYPHNTQMAAYFDSYVDHFGFRDRLFLNTVVERAQPLDGGGWDVVLGNGEHRRYRALVVANGHHREPRWPDPPFPGTFAGRQMHAHDYVRPAGFEDASVVVVGMGNSAMDIAVELGTVARRVYLSSRRGAHIVPKFAFGQPIDRFNTAFPLPWAVKRALFSVILRLTIGRPQDVGLPRPDHRLGEAHPTVSQRIVDAVRRGEVTPAANIQRLEGYAVRFADGTEARADVIVYCTGYNISFPFLEGVIDVTDNRVELFHQVFAPGVADLMFVGLVQPFGALMPVAEAQSRWIADYLAGTYTLPPTRVMRDHIRAADAHRRRQFVASPRHTLEIDFYGYLRAIRREQRRGRTRTDRPTDLPSGAIPVASSTAGHAAEQANVAKHVAPNGGELAAAGLVRDGSRDQS